MLISSAILIDLAIGISSETVVAIIVYFATKKGGK